MMMMPDVEECMISMKPGWTCTRGYHSSGPCALVKTDEVEPELCKTCSKPRNAHPFKHPFNDGSLSMRDALPSATRQRREVPSEAEPVRVLNAPFDPVLRQALIDLGVITPENLRDAEAKIIAVSGMFHTGMTGANDGVVEGR